MRFTYEESERNWARTLCERSEASDCQEYMYLARRNTCAVHPP
jgi:hypothetical protein